MKKILVLGSLILVVCFSLFLSGSTASAQSENSKRVIVVYNDNAVDLSAYEFHSLKKLNAINGESGIIPEGKLNALKNNPNVKYVVNDDIVTIIGKSEYTVTADTLPWGITTTNSNDVWSTYTGIGVKVAVLDTGMDMDHPDLVANIKGGYNTISPSKTPEDDNGHGTHVAGTIAADNNGIGVIGVAPDAQLYAVKVLNRSGSGYTSDIIEGIQWAINNNMDIISMSLGGALYNAAFNDACQQAYAAGIIIVAATGNENTSVSYPAAYDHVIGVAATDSNNIRASFSNYGPQVDVSAPGVDILSTYYRGQYATGSGTSMATPHVSGMIALMIQAGNGATYEQILNEFATGCIDLGAAGKDNYYGYGLINAPTLTD